ncbi:MAG: molybdopterin-dependent oxidoreductase [Myxococcales bacterium]|nr:molybdopterin-dependent oxidoreductase [Myxococcales bacterium]
MAETRVLRTRAVRIDAADKAAGRALYTDDLRFPGMLHAALLQSPHAHARIRRIDVSRARAMPGVVDVITAAEAPSTPFGVSPARYDETIFPADRVRYVGDEVAAVAAEDEETALRALGAIEVDYEPLPAVLDAFEALRPGAPQVHEKYPNNVTGEVHDEFGDVAAAEAQAEVKVSGRLCNRMQDGAFLEPQACIAQYDARGFLTLWSSTQAPHYVQRTLSMVLGVPIGKVRVVKPAVGGGFGPKAACGTHELATCLLAMRTGRPVKLRFTREQVFLHSRSRHQFFHEMEIGAKRDGTLLYLKHKNVMDGGAYSSFGIATVYYAGSLLGAPYRLPNMRYDGWRAATNKPACGAQRGHGGVIARALFEVLMDDLARRLGRDPIDLRLQNVMGAGETTCNHLDMSSLGMRECLEAVRDGSAWKERETRRAPGRGIGAACGFFVSGAGYPIYRSETWHCNVIVKLPEVGGSVLVLTGAADIGQGSDTVMAMIAAEVLGVELDDVKVLSGDTDLALDLGAYSSRTTLMTGHATKMAAEDARRQVTEAVAGRLGVPPERLEWRDGRLFDREGRADLGALRQVYVKEHRGFGDPPAGDGLTFREASRIAFLERGAIVGRGHYKPPALGGTHKGAAVGTSPAYGCCAQVAEVSVDRETGQVTLHRIVGAHDCGLAINVTSVEGQMQGSMSMGLGETLFEEVKFDDRGRVCNANLGEYKIATALDAPKMECVIVESREPNGPFGAKEVGEGGIMPTMPAILNAIRDAVGVRPDEVPVTPERLKRLLDAAEGNAAPCVGEAWPEATCGGLTGPSLCGR